MGMHIGEFRHCVVRPTLEYLDQWSEAAEKLLLGTAAIESQLGEHLVNEHNGFGVYGICEAAHISVWDTFLLHHPDLASKVRGLASQRQFLVAPHLELSTNLSYATAIAWLLYRGAGICLPENPSVEYLAKQWRCHFGNNDILTERDFVRQYQQLVAKPTEFVQTTSMQAALCQA